jgi:phosphinothricin acetyltransferase
MEYFNDCRWVLENENNEVIGWCALKPVSKRECFKGVAEVSIYFDNEYQGEDWVQCCLKRLFWTAKTTDSGHYRPISF